MSRGGPIPDKPRNRPTVPEVAMALREYRKRPGCYVGEIVHIVVDDPNFKQHHADWCLARALEEGDEADIEIATMIAALTNTQRRKLAAIDTYPDDEAYSEFRRARWISQLVRWGKLSRWPKDQNQSRRTK